MSEGVFHGQRRALWLVATAELLATSLWFSGTAAIPQLTIAWHTDVSGFAAAALTTSVQLGFVVGALVSAVFNLADVLHAPRLFAASAFLAALCNAGFAGVAEESLAGALVLRFLTGAAMAGVYPVGMKILSGWFRDGRATAIGILVGALTVGKGMPYLLEGVSGLPWRGVVVAGSGLALLGALLVGLGVREGPYALPSPPVDFHQVRAIVHNRRLRLANLGYFGHMWELYAMWSWVAVLLAASVGGPTRTTALGAFAAIAAGYLGCYWAGRVSDAPLAEASDERRLVRRANVAIIAMAVSGMCCGLVAAVFHNFWLLVAVCFVWGVAVVADSAQFSTIVSEVSDMRYIGTALTMQTALGFLLTVVSIRVTGAIAGAYGWRVAAASMAIGPALGILAMLRLTQRSGGVTSDQGNSNRR